MHLGPTAVDSCLCGGACRCMHGPSHIMLLLRRRRRRALYRAPWRRARLYPPPTRCPTRRADRALIPARLRGQLCGISLVLTVGAPRRRLLNRRRALRQCSRPLRQCSRPLRQCRRLLNCSRPLRQCSRPLRQFRQHRPQELRQLASRGRRELRRRPFCLRPTPRPTKRPTQRPTQCPRRRRAKPSAEMLPRGMPARVARLARCSGRAVRQ